jgi:hypothetical protein
MQIPAIHVLMWSREDKSTADPVAPHMSTRQLSMSSMLGPGAGTPAEAEGSRQPFHPGTIVEIRGDNNSHSLLSLASHYPRISTSSPNQSPLNAVKRQAPPDSSLLYLRRPWHMPPPPTLTEGPLTGHHRQLPMLLQALSSPGQRSKSAASGS